MTAAPPSAVSPPAPHGGRLTERLVAPDRADALAAEATRLPAVPLDGRALADLECLAVGAFSPLTGFLGPADYAAVVEHGRLADGQVWTLPVVLGVPADALASGPDRLALTDRDGTVLAVVDVEDVHDPDPATEAKFVFETDDPAHPGVAATLARTGPLVGGPVHVLRLPAAPAELGPRLTPAQVRAEAAARGWRTLAGFQTRNPVHRAHEYLHKVALEPAPPGRGDQGRRRARRAAHGLLPGAAGRLLPGRAGAAERVPGGDALRRAAGGGVPRPGAQELRLHPLHRRP